MRKNSWFKLCWVYMCTLAVSRGFDDSFSHSLKQYFKLSYLQWYWNILIYKVEITVVWYNRNMTMFCHKYYGNIKWKISMNTIYTMLLHLSLIINQIGRGQSSGICWLMASKLVKFMFYYLMRQKWLMDKLLLWKYWENVVIQGHWSV